MPCRPRAGLPESPDRTTPANSTIARFSRRRESGCGCRSTTRRACGPIPTRRGSWWDGAIGRLRAWSRARLVERLDPQTAPLAAALLLGQREEIEPEVNDAFARTGTTHLLAISGLQLQALAWALLYLFRLAGLPRRPAYLTVAVAMCRLCVGGRTRSFGGSFDRHDRDLLLGRHRPADGPAGQHALAGRAGNTRHQSQLPVRRRLPALVPGDRSAGLACSSGVRTRAPGSRDGPGLLVCVFCRPRRARAPVRAMVAHRAAQLQGRGGSTPSSVRPSSGWRRCRSSQCGSI